MPLEKQEKEHLLEDIEKLDESAFSHLKDYVYSLLGKDHNKHTSRSEARVYIISSSKVTRVMDSSHISGIKNVLSGSKRSHSSRFFQPHITTSGRRKYPIGTSSLLKHPKADRVFVVVDVKEKISEKYINGPEDVWKLRAFFPPIPDSMHQLLTNEVVEKLFAESRFEFYLDAEEKYIFSNVESSDIRKFGELHSIPALDALKKFGLNTLEKTKEKGRVKINMNV